MNDWPDLGSLDPELVSRYDKRGPRYTSYPTAPHFTPDMDREAFGARVRATSTVAEPIPVSVYVHVPYCPRKCVYCGCHSAAIREDDEPSRYLEVLLGELELSGYPRRRWPDAARAGPRPPLPATGRRRALHRAGPLPRRRVAAHGAAGRRFQQAQLWHPGLRARGARSRGPARRPGHCGAPPRLPPRPRLRHGQLRPDDRAARPDPGNPDAYDPASCYFVAQNTLAYASAVCGTMVREKPATNFFMGPFHAESLVLAETGAGTGAIQIAGCDMVTQLPFFIVSCDYTLIGEELYAASAYLAREPLLLGALKGTDAAKLVFMIMLVVTSILSLLLDKDLSIILNTNGWNW